MIDTDALADLLRRLETLARVSLALLPTPIHSLKNFGQLLGGPDLWIKRDDLSGFEGGGNKSRKLEFLVGDALSQGADMLVTVGAIQSNHTRQTAAAASQYPSFHPGQFDRLNPQPQTDIDPLFAYTPELAQSLPADWRSLEAFAKSGD